MPQPAPQRLLEGAFTDPNSHPDDLPELQLRVARLERELEDARREVRATKNESAEAKIAMGSLRAILSPLYGALQRVFGELEVAGVDTDSAAGPAPPGFQQKKTAAWQLWIDKLPGKRAEFIRALLDHGEMTREQIKVATKSGNTTVSDTISKLKGMGLVEKNGDKYSLKEL
jgi:hypothetical protein